MIEFLYHDGIQKEIAALERRFRTIRDGLSAFERLCEAQFNPIDNYNDGDMNRLALSRVSDFF